jgi:hypothetical protein
MTIYDCRMNSPEYEFLLKRVNHLMERVEDMESDHARSVGRLEGRILALERILDNLPKTTKGELSGTGPGAPDPGIHPARE